MVQNTIGTDIRTLYFEDGEIAVLDFAGKDEYSMASQLFLSAEVMKFCFMFSAHFIFKMGIYLLCFDLRASIQEQQVQIAA